MTLMFPIMLSLSEVLVATIILGLICNAVTVAFFAAPLASLVSSLQPERGEGERERKKTKFYFCYYLHAILVPYIL